MLNLIAPLFDLPWWQILAGTVVAYLVGKFWYGRLFRDACMKLMPNAPQDTNILAMVIHFLGLLTVAYLIGLLSLHKEIFLLGVDALIGVVILSGLADTLFQRGNNPDAFRLWGIHAAYETLAISIIAAIIWYF